MKENLPSDYGRIYSFPNFRAMIKQIQNEQENNKLKQDEVQVRFLFYENNFRILKNKFLFN